MRGTTGNVCFFRLNYRKNMRPRLEQIFEGVDLLGDLAITLFIFYYWPRHAKICMRILNVTKLTWCTLVVTGILSLPILSIMDLFHRAIPCIFASSLKMDFLDPDVW